MVLSAMCEIMVFDGEMFTILQCSVDTSRNETSLGINGGIMRFATRCLEDNRIGFVYDREAMSCYMIHTYHCGGNQATDEERDIVYLRKTRELAHGNLQ